MLTFPDPIWSARLPRYLEVLATKLGLPQHRERSIPNDILKLKPDFSFFLSTAQSLRSDTNVLMSFVNLHLFMSSQMCTGWNNSHPRSFRLWKNCHLTVLVQILQLRRHHLRRVRRERKRDVRSIAGLPRGKSVYGWEMFVMESRSRGCVLFGAIERFLKYFWNALSVKYELEEVEHGGILNAA